VKAASSPERSEKLVKPHHVREKDRDVSALCVHARLRTLRVIEPTAQIYGCGA
jgi:hypothetical protein